MLKIHEGPLAAKVAAVNRANAEAIRLHAELTALFEPLVGKPAVKKDGSLLAHLQKRMPPLAHDRDMIVRRLAGEYSLGWEVWASELVKHGEHATHQNGKAQFQVGRLRDGVLTELTPLDPVRVDYDAGEVLALREELKIARRQYNEAQLALDQFGEGD